MMRGVTDRAIGAAAGSPRRRTIVPATRPLTQRTARLLGREATEVEYRPGSRSTPRLHPVPRHSTAATATATVPHTDPGSASTGRSYPRASALDEDQQVAAAVIGCCTGAPAVRRATPADVVTCSTGRTSSRTVVTAPTWRANRAAVARSSSESTVA